MEEVLHFADGTQFPRWTCLIARYEILMARRGHARSRLVLDEDLARILVEADSEDGVRLIMKGPTIIWQANAILQGSARFHPRR